MALHARQLRVLDPCSVFDPDQRVSHCGHCNKNVHDLSRMTEREARRLLRRNEGQPICVAYHRRADGTLRFRPSAMPLGVVALAGMVAGCASTSDAFVERNPESCPVIKHAPRPEVEPQPETEQGVEPPTRVRVNFAIDPDAGRRMVGIVVPGYKRQYGSHTGHHEPLAFQPSSELWGDFVDRVRDRRERRKRRRAKRR